MPQPSRSRPFGAAPGAFSLVLAVALATALRAEPGAGQATLENAARPAPEESLRLVPDPPRGASARAVAVRIDERLRIDGSMDEAVWATIPPVADFVQRDPVDGGIPSERTEMRVAYDEDNLYFGLKLFDSDPSAILAANLRRGGQNGLDDHIVIGLDTFNDRRNGYLFEVNSLGAQDDAIFTDETLHDWNWDGVYASEAQLTAEGWELEVAIPFTTIRFPREEVLEMGLLVFRSIRRKNETVFWPQLPATYRASYAQASQYGTLTGIRGVAPGRNIQVKPYLLAGGQKASLGADTQRELDAGLDVKVGLTSSLTLDLTYNTDFAQVEADNVQVNLDRFSLFYPEKREFFLERAGLFAFGEAGETEVFFSRTIGLENPVLGGGRLTGQIGRFSVGLLNLQTGRDGERDGANNGVARVRADLGPRTSVGGLVTNLEQSAGGSRSAGLDAQLRFLGSSSFDVWIARVWDDGLGLPSPSSAPAPADGDGAGAARLQLRNASYGAMVAYTDIGETFNPALGFVQRTNQVAWAGELAYTPRFERSEWARNLSIFLRGEEIDGQDGIRQSGRRSLDSSLNLRTGDGAGASLINQFERLEAPFRIRTGTTVPVGDYSFTTVSANVRTNASRPLSGNASASTGQFYGGDRTQVRAGLRVTPSKHISIGTNLTRNLVSLPVENGRFTTHVMDVNVQSALNRSLLADALIQYDDVSHRVQANLRINWIHTPGSNLFVVFDTGYNSGALPDPRQTRWERRTGVVKLSYLWAL